MKTQILSRIQSQQNIQVINAPSLKRIDNTATATEQDNPYGSVKNLNLPYKLPSKKFFQSTTAALLDPTKKTGNKSCQSDKHVLNFNYKSMHKNRDKKNFVIQKKNSGGWPNTQIPSQNTINTLNNLPNISNNIMKDIKSSSSGHNYIRKTTSNKNSASNTFKTFKTIAAEQQKQSAENLSHTPKKKQPLAYSRPINQLMNTVNVFKDYRQSPYFALYSNSNSKLNVKSSQKNKPVRSLYRIPTDALPDKQMDVSIQLSQQPTKPLLKPEQCDDIDFGCSEIQQKQVENDSSFLSSAQHQVLNQMQQRKQENNKKRVWKKLPIDFLKN